MMQVFVQLVSKPIKKSVQWYLSKPRNFKYQDINITVDPGVFHPGFFFSTRFILKFLATQNLLHQNFLEVGSGSGLISVFASKKGAFVTAIDINSKAVLNTLKNGKKNNAAIDVRESDLFSNVPPIRFDWIVINPPYYPVNPKNEAEFAWNCGLNHQYFEGLFSNLQYFTTENSHTLIVLSDVCDLSRIFEIAKSYHFYFEKITQKRVWADGWNYLFWVKRF